MPYYYLSDEDKQLLDWVIADARNRLGSPLNSKITRPDYNVPGAPEVYLAYPAAAINPVTYTDGIGIGSGDADADVAGEGSGNLLRIDPNTAEVFPMGGYDEPETLSRSLFNLSPNKLTSEPMLIIREKGGRWIPVALSGVLQGDFAVHTDHSPCDIEVGTVTYSCILQALPATGYHYAAGGVCYIARTQSGWEVISIVDCAVADTGTAS